MCERALLPAPRHTDPRHIDTIMKLSRTKAVAAVRAEMPASGRLDYWQKAARINRARELMGEPARVGGASPERGDLQGCWARWV